MLTPNQIEAMTHDQAQAELDRMAREYFGLTRWKAAFAAIIGYDRQTVQNWYRKGHRPPIFALVLLSALIDLRAAAIHLENVKAAIDFASN